MLDRKGERKYLNWREREAFFKALKNQEAVEKAFCLTLFYSGCRISEALNLTWNRVDFGEQALVFETLKRRKRGHFRSVPVPDTLVAMLRNLQGSQEETGGTIWKLSRSTGYRLIRDKMKDAGIGGIKATPRGLRHSYAIAYVSRGVPLNVVQKWLGHAQLQTTAIYSNAINEEERELAGRLWKTI